MLKKFGAVCLAAVLLLTGCTLRPQENGSKVQSISRPAVESAELQFTHPVAGDTVAVFDTSAGVFRAVLFPEKAPQACGTGGCRHVARSCPDFSTFGNIFYNYLYAQDNFLMEPLPSAAGPVEKCCFPHSGRKITAPAAVCFVNSLR